MRRLLSVVAARMGTLAVAQSMANDIALPRQTLSRYLDLLELIFVIKRIPAWSSNLTTRAISTPKLIVTDSGLGGRLIGMSEERAKDPIASVRPLLENFAIGILPFRWPRCGRWTDQLPNGGYQRVAPGCARMTGAHATARSVKKNTSMGAVSVSRPDCRVRLMGPWLTCRLPMSGS